MIAIVIPVLNQYELCVNALESVKTDYVWTPFIVDQWRNRRPLSGAWNVGIERARAAGYHHILVTNDDILFSPWTIDALVDRLSYDDVVMATGVNDRGKYANPGDILTIDKPTGVTESENPDFSCFMVRSTFFDEVGTFDENLYPAYFEDNDCHIRINVLGLKAVSTTAASYYHYGSKTQNTRTDEADPKRHEHFQNNQQYLQAKWGTCDAHALNYQHPFNDPNFSPKEWHSEWRFSGQD